MNPITSIFRNKSRAETVLIDTLGNKMFGSLNFYLFIYLFLYLLGSKPVHFNDFFEKNLVQNMASLLNIDGSRIRVVEIVNAAEKNRRRRRTSNDEVMTVTIEIGDPPERHISYTPENTFAPGNSS